MGTKVLTPFFIYRISLAPNFHWQATVTALKEALRTLPDAPNFSIELLCD